METHEKTENPELSIKNDMIILILAFISLFILNWQVQIKFLQILAGIMLILISGFGLTSIFFPKKDDMSFLSRIIVSPIVGILLSGFWSLILGLILHYGHYNSIDFYYTLVIVPILVVMFLIRIVSVFKSKKSSSSFSKLNKNNRSSGKARTSGRFETDNNLTTAQAAALAEKEKLMKIRGKTGKIEKTQNSKQNNPLSISNKPKSGNESNLDLNKPFPSPMPRPVLKNQKSLENSNELINGINKNRETSKSKSNINNSSYSNKPESNQKSKWAFKSQENTKIDPSTEKIEIIKVRKSSKDIILVLLLTILSGIFIFLPLQSAMAKLPFVILLIFFISGYSILTGLFINFSEKGVLKRVISSILVSIVLIIGITSSLTFLKIQIPSNYIYTILIVVSLLMAILGHIRRIRNQKEIKKTFGYEKSNAISEKNELNVLTLSSTKTTTNNSKSRKSIFKRNSRKKKHPQNQIKENNSISFPNNEINLKDSKNLNTTNGFSTREFETKPGKDITPTESKKSKLTPSDARNLVMSRKKEKEKFIKKNSSETSIIYGKIDSDDKELEKTNLKKTEFKKSKSSKLTKSETPTKASNLTLLKFVTVVILSVVGFILTIPSISSFLSFSSSDLQVNSLVSLNIIVSLIFIVPILLYLPGYGLKELFLKNKFSGIVFTTAISIIISLSLDIILAFVLLYIEQYFTEITFTLNLYIGILSLISILSISIGFLKSKYKNNSKMIIDSENEDDIIVERNVDEFENDKKDNENEDKTNEIISKENKISSNLKTITNTDDSNYNLKPLKTDNESLFDLNRKSKPISGDKPVQKMYMEEELERSFSSVGVFESKSSPHNKSPEQSLYPRSPKKSLYPLDLLIMFILTIITIMSIYTPFISKTPINTILGLLFVLFIPGYVLICALFPKKEDLENLERLALSFGLSLAISPLIGLALNYTSFGTKLTPIVISLSTFTLIMILVAYIRRRSVVEENRFQPDISGYLSSLKKSFKGESRMDKILSIILIISLVLAVITTAYIIVMPKEGEKFTEFYILGPNGKASDYPTNLTLGQSGKLFVGVVNHEYSTMNYKVVVKLQGNIINTEQITLKNNQKWEKEIIFTPNVSGNKQNLEFILYKLPDDKNAYRSLHLWVNVA